MGIRCYIYAIGETEVIRIEENQKDLTEVFKATRDHIDLDKSWPAIHFLLTGTAGKDDFPFNFILAGGRPVPGTDADYGEARYFSPVEVKAIYIALSIRSSGELLRYYDPKIAIELYPFIWDPKYIEEYFTLLKDYLRDLCSQGKPMFIQIA
jgi:hypothetical protein